jgi:hypothetical protein
MSTICDENTSHNLKFHSFPFVVYVNYAEPAHLFILETMHWMNESSLSTAVFSWH